MHEKCPSHVYPSNYIDEDRVNTTSFFVQGGLDVELTFEQQAIVALIGGVVASVLTSFLNNWWTDRRLRDQWEREKEERREQWRREQEARRSEWKRQYREGLLLPFLEKVNKLMGTVLILHSPATIQAAGGAKKVATQIAKLGQDILSAMPVGIDDSVLPQLARKYVDAFARYYAAQREANKAAMEEYLGEMGRGASELNKRVEELLEETFD